MVSELVFLSVSLFNTGDDDDDGDDNGVKGDGGSNGLTSFII